MTTETQQELEGDGWCSQRQDETSRLCEVGESASRDFEIQESWKYLPHADASLEVPWLPEPRFAQKPASSPGAHTVSIQPWYG